MVDGLFIEARGERKPDAAGFKPLVRWSRRMLMAGCCLALLGAAGCGQKGDLYLPDKAGKQQQQ